MAYIHESRMMDAVKRLYMLGNKPHRDKTEMAGTEGLAAAGQAAIAKMKAAGKGKKAEPSFQLAGGTIPETGIRGEMQQLSGGASMNRQELSNIGAEGVLAPKPNWAETNRKFHMSDVDRAVALGEQEKFREEMPLGGVYTASGLQKASQDADLNAMDRMRLKSLMGQGMRLSTPLGGN